MSVTTNIVKLILQRQAEAQKRDVLNIWTIYDKPKDFPFCHVARRWEAGGGLSKPVATEDCFTGDLATIRAAFYYNGFYLRPRDPEDDACIVESWL